MSQHLASSLSLLNERVATINDVLNASSVLVWDSRTMMPSGGAQTRGQQIATLTGVALDMLLSPKTHAALETAEAALAAGEPDDTTQRLLLQVRQAIEHHRRIPVDLTQRRTGLRSVAQAAWVQARERNDYSLFAPYLERTIDLAR